MNERADLLTYYASLGVMTEPGTYARLLDGLPSEAGPLSRVVQGITLHIFWAGRYGVDLSDEQKVAVQIRPVAGRLAALMQIDGSPLTEARPPEKRLVGNCRDFTLTMCAMLRHQGLPARARCGFGVYFLPDHFEDHWVCDVWDAGLGRWRMVDAQLDELQRRALGITFDTLDLPEGQFWTGGKAWQACRKGQEDPEKFGIFEYHGMDFIKGNLVRDFLALNKVEILPWDFYGPLLKKYDEHTADELAMFDRMAELTLGGDAAFSELQEMYEGDAGLHIPAEWTAQAAV